MNKMVDHAKEITQNFDEMLFYDPDEFLNQVLEDEREEYRKKVAEEKAQEIAKEKEIGKTIGKKEVAINLIKADMDLKFIADSTGLSFEEVKELKETIEK